MRGEELDKVGSYKGRYGSLSREPKNTGMVLVSKIYTGDSDFKSMVSVQ